jgi:hypothetical protein
MPTPALNVPPTPGRGLPPHPSPERTIASESPSGTLSESPSGSLEDIRTSLAGDVLAFLTATTPRTSLPHGEALTEVNADERVTQRQVLLRAAITDLKVMDVRLHHDRH